jgi:DNA-binding HxlR family transcriptional regulator
MVSRLTGDGAMSASALSREIGISQGTLSRWLREAGTLGGMSKSKKNPPPQSPRDWPLERKLRVVLEALSLSDKELGAFLRREGLHEAQLEEMRSAVELALSGKKKKPSKQSTSEAKRIKKLEQELSRKEKALAEVTALLVLKKKLEAYYLGEEEGDTKGKSGK